MLLAVVSDVCVCVDEGVGCFLIRDRERWLPFALVLLCMSQYFVVDPSLSKRHTRLLSSTKEDCAGLSADDVQVCGCCMGSVLVCSARCHRPRLVRARGRLGAHRQPSRATFCGNTSVYGRVED